MGALCPNIAGHGKLDIERILQNVAVNDRLLLLEWRSPLIVKSDSW